MKRTLTFGIAVFLCWANLANAQEVFPPNGTVPAGWVQGIGANASWVVSSDFASEGTFSLKSAPIGNNETAAIQFTKLLYSGNLTFRLKVSSEKFGDYFRLYVDGVDQTTFALSGDVDWTTVTYPIGLPGVHEIRFVYKKDPSASGFLDAAWIDSLQLPPVPQPPPYAAPNDLSGDGNSDLVLGYVNGGTFSYMMNGLGVAGGGLALPVGSPWTVTHIADFNGDGKSDLLLRHVDETIAIQLMDGVSTLSSVALIGPASGWKTTNTGDFNGDGKADLVFQHTDGRVFVALMNGTTVLDGRTMLEADSTRPSPFFTHAADINGDGKADLAYAFEGRVPGLGGNSYPAQFVGAYFMNGTVTRGGMGVHQLPRGNTSLGLGWTISHLADLNGDGRADFVLRHTDGRVYAYLYGAVGSNALDVPLGANVVIGAGSGWTVTEVVDLDGDRKADLIFTHTDGSVFVYLMDGLSSPAGGFVLGANTGWKITKSADFNGDGKADLLFNYTDGSLYIYLMNGLTPIGGGLVLGGNTGWTPLP